MSAGTYAKLNVLSMYLVLIGFLLAGTGSEEIVKQAKNENNNEVVKLTDKENVPENSEDAKEDANVLSTGGRAKPPSQTIMQSGGPSADPPKIIEQPRSPVAENGGVNATVVKETVVKETLSEVEKGEETTDTKPDVIETKDAKVTTEESKALEEEVVDPPPQLKSSSSQNEDKANDLENKENLTKEKKEDEEDEVVNEEKGEDEEEKEDKRMEEEEIVAQEAGEDMVSFDEWKKKRLAEQAQLDRKEGGSKSPINTPSQSKVKTSKNRINFASATCGAKILTSNNGAQNPTYLLTENKDQYMINSCKAKKWFIVELCEPVQVHSIELGNLELFSSLPQEFVASISDRYPSKEWKSLGVFHAREERSIQSFSVGENPIYAKYLKVEMITHYGHEHFCTLSILRVFGSTVVEDDDDNDDDSPTHAEPNLDPEISDDLLLDQDAEGKEAKNDDEKSSNLFSTATDTVLSLVKNVLSPNDVNEKTLQEVKEGVSHNASTKNETPKVEKEEEAEPCAPDARVSADPNEDVALCEKSLPEVPDPSVDVSPPTPDVSEPEAVATREEIPIVTIIDPKDYPESVEENVLIRLIEKPKNLKEILADCFVCSELESNAHCSVRLSNSCVYYALWWTRAKEKNEAAEEPVKTTNKSNVEVLQPSITIAEAEEKITETLSEQAAQLTDVPSSVSVEEVVTNATETVQMSATVVEASEEDVAMTTEANDSKVIYAERTGDLQLESVPPPNTDEMQYQKLGSRGKETLLMRLKNRVTDLEMNLSLSSRYLEELSQRYKRQMEEMYRSLNKTITKFSNVTKSTEKKGNQQEVQIQQLQVQLSDVASQLLRLERSMDNLSTALVERQFTFLFVEVIVFTVILSVCLGRRREEKRQVAPPMAAPVKRSGHTRTASLDVSPNRKRTDTERTKSGSEGDLNIIPLNAVLVPSSVGNDFDVNRIRAKRKKRKSNPLPASMLTGDKICAARRSSSMASTQHSPSAGVIFNPVHQATAVRMQLPFSKQNGTAARSHSCERLRKSRSMEKDPSQQKRRGKVKGEGDAAEVKVNGQAWCNGVEEIGRRKSMAQRRNSEAIH